MEKQTYWQQLAGKGINAVIFWILVAIILFCLYLLVFGHNEAGGAGLVLAVAAGAQALNMLVTYFSKERRSLH